MSATWLINGSSPESLGLSVVGGTFQSGSASTVELRAEVDFDAAELESYGDAVAITRNGSPFFTGRIRRIPKSGSASREGHSYVVEDAWADMERTTYQELWPAGGTTVLIPRAILGVDDAGVRINLGEQIGEALDFAIASGISIQKGTIPTGLLLWPEEVDGMSIAEVIRASLRYHPDWIPWIDHSTSPPTFNVTPVSTATALSIAVTACSDLQVTELADRLPDVVRIAYVTASQIDDDVVRTIAVDKWPTGGADSGPGVLSTTVDLQGVRATTQKQQVEVRDLPTDQTELKAWLKLKFPAIAELADAKFDVTAPTLTVVDDTPVEDLPPPINPNATRLRGSTTTDLPRELVRGAIHEWMRRKVGQVRVDYRIRPSATATQEDAEKIAKVPNGISVTGTNATTKTYHGLASWEAEESAPTGVAQAYYDTIRNGARFEGGITVPDAALAGWHGRKLNLTGGVTAWATMAAPIHSIQWDGHTGTATVSFGPTPQYAFQDFQEYLKLLRRRVPTWMSAAERTSEEIGAEESASASGDVIGQFDTPRDVPEPLPEPTHPWKVTVEAGGTVTVAPGKVIGVRTALSPLPSGTELETDAIYYPYKTTHKNYAGGTVTATAEGWVYAEVPLAVGAAAQSGLHAAESTFHDIKLSYPSADITNVYFSTTSPDSLAPSTADRIHIAIAKVAVAAGVYSLDEQILTHNPVIQITSFGVQGYI